MAKLTCSLLLALGFAISTPALSKDQPGTQEPAAKEPLSKILLAQDDKTAECLTDCRKKVAACTGGGAMTAKCADENKKCIEACGSGKKK